MRIRNGRGAAGSKPTVGPGAEASASAAASALSFLNRRWRGLVLVGLTAATSAAVAVPASASASSDASPVVGHVYVNDNTTGTNTIGAFDRHADGTLTAEPGSPFAAQGLGPFGSEFRPTNPRQLFVSNAHNGGGAGTVSAFRDTAHGTLTSIGSSPFADNQTAPCWVEITQNGRFLFTTNTASG